MNNSSHAVLRLAVAASMALAAAAAQAQMYFRVDVGASDAHNTKMTDKNFAADGLICSSPACTTGAELHKLGSSKVLSAGVGWHLPPVWRMDLMLAYRDGFKLDDDDGFPSHFSAKIRSTTLMLGSYWDVALGWGTPYVGLGLGASQNKIEPIINSGGALGATTITVPGGDTTNFAWSLMAGVGIPLGGRTVLDLGIRYIDLGKIETHPGPVTCSPACPGATYSGMKGTLQAYELMVGLRF